MPEGAITIPGIREESEDLDFVPDLEEDASEETETNDAGSETETTRETVERELNRLKNEASGEDSKAQTNPAAQGGKTKGSKEPVAAAITPVPAPARMTAAQKELFEKLPPELQKSMAKTYSDLHGMATKATQAARKAEREATHVVEAVRPYLLAHPELQAEGFTEARLVSSLLAAHQRLSDPKTAKKAYAELGMQIGIDADKISDLLGEDATPRGNDFDISQHPQFVALQTQLNQVTSVLGGAQKQKEQAAVGEAFKEVEALQNERDQFGRFRYPKLHDGDFLERTKPLVSALARSLPSLGYGELLRRAHDILEGQGSPPQGNQPRLAANNSNKQLATQAAGVSVRGKSAPAVSGQMEEIPDEALGDARSSALWALKQLRRG